MKSCYRISVVLTVLLVLGASHPFNYHPEQWPANQDDIKPTYYQHRGQEWPNAYSQAYYPGQIQARQEYRPGYNGYTPELHPVYKDPGNYQYQAYPPINQHHSSDVSGHAVPITVPVRSKTMEIVTSSNGVGDPIVHLPVSTNPEQVRVFRLDTNGNIARRDDGTYEEVPEHVRKYLSMRGRKTGEQVESRAHSVATTSIGNSPSDDSLAPRISQIPSKPIYKRPTPEYNKAQAVAVASSGNTNSIAVASTSHQDSYVSPALKQKSAIPKYEPTYHEKSNSKESTFDNTPDRAPISKPSFRKHQFDDTSNKRHEPDLHKSSFDQTPSNGWTPGKDSRAPIPFPTSNKGNASPSSGRQPGSYDSRAPEHEPEPKFPVSVPAKPEKKQKAEHPIGNHDQPESKKKPISALPTEADEEPAPVTELNSDESEIDYTPNRAPVFKSNNGDFDDTSNESHEPVSMPDLNEFDQNDPRNSRAPILFPTTTTNNNKTSTSNDKQSDSYDSSTPKYKRETPAKPILSDKKYPTHPTDNHHQTDPRDSRAPILCPTTTTNNDKTLTSSGKQTGSNNLRAPKHKPEFKIPVSGPAEPAPVTEPNSDESSSDYTTGDFYDTSNGSHEPVSEPDSNEYPFDQNDPRNSRAPILFPTTRNNNNKTSTTSGKQSDSNDSSTPKYKREIKAPISAPAKPILSDKKYPIHPTDNHIIPEFKNSGSSLSTEANEAPAPTTDPNSDESPFDTPTTRRAPEEVSKAPIYFPTTNKDETSTTSGEQPDNNDSPSPTHKPESKILESVSDEPTLLDKKHTAAHPSENHHHVKPEHKSKSKPAHPKKVDSYSEQPDNNNLPAPKHEPESKIPESASDKPTLPDKKHTAAHPSENHHHVKPEHKSKSKPAHPKKVDSYSEQPDSNNLPAPKHEPESKIPESASDEPTLPDKKHTAAHPSENHHHVKPEPKEKSKPAHPKNNDKEHVPVTYFDSDESPESASDKPTLPDKKHTAAHPSDNHHHVKPEPKEKSKPAHPKNNDKEHVPVTDFDSDESPESASDKPTLPDKKHTAAHPSENHHHVKPQHKSKSKPAYPKNNDKKHVPVTDFNSDESSDKPTLPDKKDTAAHPSENHHHVKPEHKSKSKPAYPKNNDKKHVPVTDFNSDESSDKPTLPDKKHTAAHPSENHHHVKPEPKEKSKPAHPKNNDKEHVPVTYFDSDESPEPASDKPTLPDKKHTAAHPSDNHHHVKPQPKEKSKPAHPKNNDKEHVPVTDFDSDESSDKPTLPDKKHTAAHPSDNHHHVKPQPKKKSKPAHPKKANEAHVPVTDSDSDESPIGDIPDYAPESNPNFGKPKFDDISNEIHDPNSDESQLNYAPYEGYSLAEDAKSPPCDKSNADKKDLPVRGHPDKSKFKQRHKPKSIQKLKHAHKHEADIDKPLNPANTFEDNTVLPLDDKSIEDQGVAEKNEAAIDNKDKADESNVIDEKHLANERKYKNNELETTTEKNLAEKEEVKTEEIKQTSIVIEKETKKVKIEKETNIAVDKENLKTDKLAEKEEAKSEEIKQTTIVIEKKSEKLVEKETSIAVDEETVKENDDFKTDKIHEENKFNTEERKYKENPNVKSDDEKKISDERKSEESSSEESSSEKSPSEEQKSYVVNELKNRQTNEEHKKKNVNSAYWIWDMFREGIKALLVEKKT